jgi:hypothetical protein
MRKGWEYKKLGDCTQILDSQRKPVTKRDRKSGIYPYYGATGIQDYVDKYIFDGRYVLVGEDGAKWSSFTQSAFIIEGKTWVNNHAHVLRTNDFLVDSFLVYFLNYSDLDSYISGAIIRKLTQASLRNIDIPLPPKSTQLAIVSELDKINELIRLKKEQLKDFDNLAQSLFYEMFGDPVENEKGWEVKKLGEICEIFAGGDKPKDMCEIQNNEYIYPVIANGEGEKGILGYTKNCRVTKEAVTIGARGASIGNCRIVKNGFTPAIRLLTLIPTGSIDCCFLYYFVKDLNYKQNGAGQAQLTVPNIKCEFIPLPPLSLQRLFAQRIEQIEREKSEVQKSIQDLETLLASRMQYWFE